MRPERKGYDKVIYEQHVNRLKTIQPTVDNKPPHEKPMSNKWEQDKVITLAYRFVLFIYWLIFFLNLFPLHY